MTRRQGLRCALYARYSTDKQSENSIADQFRVCVSLAERNGFEVVARFSDAALSGGTAKRDGYQDLLEAARRDEFDVIVAEDVSRLWRLLAEQAPRLAELRDLGVEVVTLDLDTRQESAGILGAVSGAMSEHYRQEIARRTRRGLEGRARAHKATGGRAYGYVAARDSKTGEREIDAEQAEVVRRIFQEYADGKSPRSVAAQLNREGVPSPGSTWKRNERRQNGWMASAIAGDPARGVGILNNELYIGRVIWNRFKWVRSAADSSKRRYVLNPETEWVVHRAERLRIVPQSLWERVKARQKARSEDIGEPVRRGQKAAAPKRTGRKPKFLFSGLLRCGLCGARFVIADRTHYACSSRVNGGEAACASDVRIKRVLVESGLLAGIKRDLLAPEVVEEIRSYIKRSFRTVSRASTPRSERLPAVEREVANLVEAVASGALRTSPALAERLAQAEAELARLKQAARPQRVLDVDHQVTRAADRYRSMVERIETESSDADLDLYRASLQELFGSIKVVADEREIRFEADLQETQTALLRAVGGSANNVVAGARFWIGSR